MSNTVKKNQTAEVKTKGGSNYSYKYVDIAQIHEYLEQNNMSYYQYIDSIDGNDYIMTVRIINGEEKPALRGARVVDATLFGNDNPAQKQGSALTYARRYSLLMAFGLATDDDDANSLNDITKEPTEEDALQWTFESKFKKHAGEKMIDVIQDDEQYVQWFLSKSATEYDKKCYELLTGEKIPTDGEVKERGLLQQDIMNLVSDTDTDYDDILNHYEVKSSSEMTMEQLKECKQTLEKKLERQLLQKAVNGE